MVQKQYKRWLRQINGRFLKPLVLYSLATVLYASVSFVDSKATGCNLNLMGVFIQMHTHVEYKINYKCSGYKI